LEKIAGSNWRAAFSGRTLPMHMQLFGGWFDFPDFYFFIVYNGDPETIYNSMGYHSTEMDKAIDAAHYTRDAEVYARSARRFISLAFDDVPAVPLFQPYLNIAMRPNVTGYRYLFHRQLDFRHMGKA
jgi:peptide/nickel transport system substrate-binding protein